MNAPALELIAVHVCRARWSTQEMHLRNQVAVLFYLGAMCGLLPIEDEVCPECEGELFMLMHPDEPMVFCQCGFVDPLDAADIDRMMPGMLEALT